MIKIPTHHGIWKGGSPPLIKATLPSLLKIGKIMFSWYKIKTNHGHPDIDRHYKIKAAYRDGYFHGCLVGITIGFIIGIF